MFLDLFRKNKELSPTTVKFLGFNFFVDSAKLRELTERKVNEINDNSTLPFKLLMPYDDFVYEDEEVNFIRNWMSRDYYSSKWTLVFSGYPNDECDYYLTKMEVDLSKYCVLGLIKGMRVNTAEKLLSEYGFEKTIEENKDVLGNISTHTCYKYCDVKMYLHSDEDVISFLTLEVETYYVGNRIY